ncbi:MAG: AraC family transcriptional regulator [Planctomycetota bacterium]|nr:MAG: AraC family transcriptional regulator [Planctomycetota bacterium]
MHGLMCVRLPAMMNQATRIDHDDVGPSFAEHPLWWLPYGPYIRSATHNLKGRHQLHLSPTVFHELISLDRGSGRLFADGQETVIEGPATLVIVPGRRFTCHIPQLAQWYSIRFTITYRRRRSPAQLAFEGPPPHSPLPSAVELFGCELPALVPDDLQASCQAMMQAVCTTWWRDPIAYQRCNYRLGWWLLDYVSSLAGATPPATDLLSRLRQAIRESLAAGTQVDGLARSLGYSRQHLARQLREQDGRSISQLIADERQEEACRLLASTDRDIVDIAFRCGYRNHAAFSRWFRQRLGHSPRAWRQRHRLGPIDSA